MPLQRLFILVLMIILFPLSNAAIAQSRSEIDAIADQLMPPAARAASEQGEFTARRWGAPKERSRGYSSDKPRASSRRSRAYQADIKFHSGSAVLTVDGKRQLDKVLGAFNKVRERTRSWSNNKEDVRFDIGGHTDAYGDEASNQRLSEKRAAAVKKYLEKKGYSGRLVDRGFGEDQPTIKSDPYDGRNRRVEVTAERITASN